MYIRKTAASDCTSVLLIDTYLPGTSYMNDCIYLARAYIFPSFTYEYSCTKRSDVSAVDICRIPRCMYSPDWKSECSLRFEAFYRPEVVPFDCFFRHRARRLRRHPGSVCTVACSRDPAAGVVAQIRQRSNRRRFRLSQLVLSGVVNEVLAAPPYRLLR